MEREFTSTDLLDMKRRARAGAIMSVDETDRMIEAYMDRGAMTIELDTLRARMAELEADNADFKKLIADELAETFKLFGVLGLNEADDFGTKTAIEAVRERIESIKADRDRLLGACKEANEWLVAMTLKAAFNQDNKAAQDEAASIVREVTSHISKAIAESARAANGGGA